ncbi:lipoate--protein ligase [Listeria weihenstephanensis]|uniref:lipoate--protein ligase n=1 Tax=Listeria weihenstephanensis TaxID=1006155 RepID=A0A841Z884_9LIST|nr:lipoate--protein ligase [Listeria weihenstephanensis]MBC1500606.1 lipoate--protein ligase [Listeria weihenstephanensis]
MIYIDNEDCLDQSRNFAMEEFALRHLDADETYVMFYRMYPTVIVGKNQNTLAEINHAYVKEHDVAVLRRLSGGGAVYNDEGNISFSIITKDDGESFNNFERFTKPVIEALKSLGVDAKLSGRNDIEVAGKKISGNAQFATKGRLYSHGTLMFDVQLENVEKALHVNPLKLQAKGIKSVRARVTNIREHLRQDMDIESFKHVLLESIFQTKNIPTYTFTEQDVAKIKEIQQERYQNWDWNYGKSPKFNVKNECKFPAGVIEVRLQVEKGRIVSAKIFGDFFATGDIAEVEKQLLGMPYTQEKIAEFLCTIDIAKYFGKITKAELESVFFLENS